jgi:formylglycine-generating enzyme required for sulfatase activity
MKKSVNRPLWLLLAVMPALVAALFLAGCKGNPDDTPPSNCATPPCEEPLPKNCDVPPCEDIPVEPPIEPPVEPAACEAVVGQNFIDETDGLNIEMVFVKCGRMKIGCDINICGETAESPAYLVELSGYYIGKFLVTQRQWKTLMGTNPSNFKGDDDLPVEQVSWNDVQEFIGKLNVQSSRKKYRLPTNAEWEYAVRGGTDGKGYKYSGGNTADDVAWHLKNSSEQTHPVGGKKANELDLYDMSGNVFEWVGDWYSKYEREKPVGTPFVNPQGPETGQSRVIRGGSWAQDTTFCRVSARTNQGPTEKSKLTGFRLAFTAE